ncbi:hypothetical protein C8R43DRAFT_636550 [Mycena crocata]|nr:hypothetical protein C8R43DRAFT_636550 [Mycena crocata]
MLLKLSCLVNNTATTCLLLLSCQMASVLWRWLIELSIRILPPRFRPRFLLAAQTTAEPVFELNDDIILYLSKMLPPETRLELSMVSHRFRRLLIPAIFKTYVWSPWAKYKSRPLPPASLRPHIRVFGLSGEGLPWDEVITTEKRIDVVAQLQKIISQMASVQTFLLRRIRGGLWSQLLEAISTAPRIYELIIESRWLPEGRGNFDIPATAVRARLRSVAYDTWFIRDPAKRAIVAMQRPMSMIEIEAQNLCSILGACQSTLETLKIPGEIFLAAMDTSTMWIALQELHVEGFWPQTERSYILSVLRAMPNLRTLRLKLGCFESDLAPGHLIPPGSSPSLDRDTFLPHLVQFEAACLLPGERILASLPHGLESLSLIHHPTHPIHSFRREIPECSVILDILADVQFSNLTSLELWYRIMEPEELVSDELLLACIPQRFPLLRHLTLHRWVLPYTTHAYRMDPSPEFRKLLPQLKHLETFSLDPNVNYCSQSGPMPYVEEQYAYIVKLLRKIAEDIVPAIPWLRQISMYRPVAQYTPWETWDVISLPGESIRLRAHEEPYAPFIQAAEIMDAPWPEDPDFVIPRSIL